MVVFFPRLSGVKKKKNLHVIIVDKVVILVISIDLVSQFGRLN